MEPQISSQQFKRKKCKCSSLIPDPLTQKLRGFAGPTICVFFNKPSRQLWRTLKFGRCSRNAGRGKGCRKLRQRFERHFSAVFRMAKMACSLTTGYIGGITILYSLKADCQGHERARWKVGRKWWQPGLSGPLYHCSRALSGSIALDPDSVTFFDVDAVKLYLPEKGKTKII